MKKFVLILAIFMLFTNISVSNQLQQIHWGIKIEVVEEIESNNKDTYLITAFSNKDKLKYTLLLLGEKAYLTYNFEDKKLINISYEINNTLNIDEYENKIKKNINKIIKLKNYAYKILRIDESSLRIDYLPKDHLERKKREEELKRRKIEAIKRKREEALRKKREEKLNMKKEAYNILNLDVYSFYNVTNYQTPLQKKYFEKSPEYKSKLKELTGKRETLLQTEFHFDLGKVNGQYNIKKKRFEMLISHTFDHFSCYYKGIPMNLFDIKNSSKDTTYFGFNFEKIKNHGYTYYLYFKVPEAVALKIENHGNARIFFKMKDTRITTFNFSPKKYFVTYNNRIEISDEETGAILFKVYSKAKSKWKKINKIKKWEITKYPNGSVKRETPITKGRSPVFGYYYTENGYIKWKYICSNGKRNGWGYQYHSNGKIKKKYYFRNDKKNGRYNNYYKNGKLKARGYYRNNKGNGCFFGYYRNGRINAKVYLSNDKIHGWVYFYNKNGRIKERHYYRNGVKIK